MSKQLLASYFLTSSNNANQSTQRVKKHRYDALSSKTSSQNLQFPENSLVYFNGLPVFTRRVNLF